MQTLKQRLIEATEEYKNSNRQNQKDSNLTKEEKEGIKCLKERDDIIILPTDKSGRFAVDTTENYIAACRVHTEGDTNIEQKEYEKLQKEINAHARSWTRILNAGQNAGKSGAAETRIRNNVTISNHGCAPLYGLRKDHKPNQGNETISPSTRPVCSGEKAYNKKLSHIMSTLLREIWRGEETTCENTEELLANIEELNNSRSERKGEIVVGSLDVKALYPSLDVDHAAEIVEKMLLESDLEFDGINSKELGLYLSLTYDERDLETMNIKEYCPSRKKKNGKPKITGKAQSNDEEKRHENWKEAEDIPDKKTQKRMLAAAVKTTIKFIMKKPYI